MGKRSRMPKTTDEKKLVQAVDAFADKMKSKLLKKAAQGSRGWDTVSPARLAQLLWDHLEKGDPIDVANFCMMLERQGFGAQLVQSFGPVKLEE